MLLPNVEHQVTDDESVLLALVANCLLFGCGCLGCCSLGLLMFLVGYGSGRVFLFGSGMGLFLLDLRLSPGSLFDLD